MSDVVLNKAFKDANETHARYRVLMGGAGSGKSTDVAMDYIAKLTDERYEGANLLVVRASEAEQAHHDVQGHGRTGVFQGMQRPACDRTSQVHSGEVRQAMLGVDRRSHRVASE